MSHKVALLVRERGSVIDGPLSERPVRRLPSGEAGAVYLGKAWPLYPGGFIELTDTPFDKGTCGFVAATEELRYRHTAGGARLEVDRWHLETNRYGNYVAFDASEQQADELTDRLHASPLGLRSWGRSVRPADDGHFYDWYARLETTDARDDVAAALADLLSAIDEPVASRSAATVLDQTAASAQATIAALAQRVAEVSQARDRLEAALADADRERTAAAAQLKAAHSAAAHQVKAAELRAQQDAARLQALAAERDETVRRLGELEGKFADLSGRAADAGADAAAAAALTAQMERVAAERNSLSARIDALTGAADDAERRAADDSLLAHEFSQECEALKADMQLLEAERDAFVARNAELENEARDLSRTSVPAEKPRRDDGLDRFLEEMFPRLVLTRDSVGTIEDRFKDRCSLFKVLRELDEERIELPKLHGTEDVHEVDRQISTGDSKRGRIYVRRLQDRRLWVFVHYKQTEVEQRRVYLSFAKAALPA